ncbi:MAG: hypothetical protein P8N09_11565 [Planctomycetota bacterium]|nr:hypothetical protein [Planctomycetota bacterium]
MSTERKQTRKEKAAEARKRKLDKERREMRNERRRAKRAHERKLKEIKKFVDVERLPDLLCPERNVERDRVVLRDANGEAWVSGHLFEKEIMEVLFRGDPDNVDELDAFEEWRDETGVCLEELILAAGWKVEHHLTFFWGSANWPMSWTLSLWGARGPDGRGVLIQQDEVEGTRRIACYRSDAPDDLLESLLGDLVATNGSLCDSWIMGGLPTALGLSSSVLNRAGLERAFWRFLLDETRGGPDRWVDLEEQLETALEGKAVPPLAEILKETLKKMTPEAQALRAEEGAQPRVRERLALLRCWLEKTLSNDFF